MTRLTDPLARPADWVDNEALWARYDLSRIRRYPTDLGFECWIDPPGGKILTSDPAVYLTFHGWGALDYSGHNYAVLHLDGDEIVITSEQRGTDRVDFSHDLAERTKDGAQIWHVDRLFRSFTVPDHESYPWVIFADYLPPKHVRGIDGFRDRQHQERAMAVLRTLLSIHGGNIMAAVRGEETRGMAMIGDALQAKLESGELIR
jgi:hypothetical protein